MNPTDAGRGSNPSRRTVVVPPLATFVLTLLVVLACRQIAGVSLGLFFGAVGTATLIVPPIAAGRRSAIDGLVIPVATTLAAAMAWVFAPIDALTWSQWFACSLVLLAYAVALAGIVAMAVSLRVPLAPAAGAVTVAGLLWLTWPVWLSHALLTPAGDAIVAWLVPAHPLFAINGVLIHFDSWDRLPLAYTRLSNLNQDVFYTLPGSVLPAVVVHLLIGLNFGGVATLIDVRRHRRVSSRSSATTSASPPAEAPAGGAP
jgi:hypothetical protein